MNSLRLVQAMTCLALWSLPASAVDLTKIERRIAKERAYETKSPKYCLLVFGPEAAWRVWLVLDGDTLLIDENANGDLTDDAKRGIAGDFKHSANASYDRERTLQVSDFSIGGLTQKNLIVQKFHCRR